MVDGSNYMVHLVLKQLVPYPAARPPVSVSIKRHMASWSLVRVEGWLGCAGSLHDKRMKQILVSLCAGKSKTRRPLQHRARRLADSKHAGKTQQSLGGVIISVRGRGRARARARPLCSLPRPLWLHAGALTSVRTSVLLLRPAVGSH